MKQFAVCGPLLLIAGAVACRKPAPVDPAVVAYHSAVVRFAEVSKLTQDLTYRDPRFDPILDSLDQIPLGSEPKPQAQALADRIRGARTLANSQQPNSDRMQAEASATPAFEPIVKLPAAMAPKAIPAIDRAQPAPADPITADLPAEGAVARAGPRGLPSWYAGYFGNASATPDDGGTPAGSEAAADQPNASPDASQSAPPPRRTRAPPPDAGEPTQVFGLPGPAGNALQGRPGAGE